MRRIFLFLTLMLVSAALFPATAQKKQRDIETALTEEKHDTITESIITALADRRMNSTQTGLKRINSKDLNSGFALFSTPDVIKTLQMMPGVSSGTELLSGFYVHGGDGSDNLFLLDGVPVYQVSHLLGLFSSFNTDVIDNLDFYKSGFPARYGSKLSSIVDVTTRDGDFEKIHGTFAVGLIDGRFQLEGPLWKGRTSFNIGLRRTWTEVLTLPFFATYNVLNKPDKQNARYAFTDLNVSVSHRFSKNNILSGHFYTGNDVLRYSNLNIQEWYDSENKFQRQEDRVSMGMSWGNVLGSLNWKWDFSNKLSMKNILYYSGSLSKISYSFEETDQDNVYTKAGEYYNSDVHNIGLKSDWFHELSPSHKLRYGATLQYHLYCPDATARSDMKSGSVSMTKVAYADSLRYNSIEAAIYAEDEINITDAFSANAGLRYALYYNSGKIWHSAEPRLALKYAFNEAVTAKASYTWMSQPAHLISSLYIDLPTNAWLPSTSKVRPSRSQEVAAGIYTALPHNIHLNVEGWYKHMYNLLEYAGSYSAFPPLTGWEDCYKSGQGRSWGAELDFGYDDGRTEVNVYYTLMWSQRKFEDFYPDWFRDRNDNRHKLTLMAKHKFTKRFEIYGAWNWHSGNWVTMATHQTEDQSVQVFLEPNNIQLPDYHRLDVGLNFIRKTKRGNTSIWNLSIYNAYCRLNPITAYVSEVQLSDKVVAYYGNSVGIIPIVPTFSYTLKF